MENNLLHQDFGSLFYFLNSDTPNEVEWLKKYIRKQGYNESNYNLTNVTQIIDYLLKSGVPTHCKNWQTFADKMKKAYRTRQTRKGKNRKKMLNVTLEPSLLKHLDTECKKHELSRSQFIEIVLDGTIQELMKIQEQKHIDNERRKNIQEYKKISDLTLESHKKQLRINELTCELDRVNNSLEKVQETLSYFFETIQQRAIHNNEYDIKAICELQDRYRNAVSINIKQT
ncbi:hypothetical protein ACRN9A_03475 [Shewanella frigidimarina]|uniref:hypothetical protein n=1 Tax=Shewanella frigidimarina TaxID=56812 RepID=UPI003D7AA31B